MHPKLNTLGLRTILVYLPLPILLCGGVSTLGWLASVSPVSAPEDNTYMENNIPKNPTGSLDKMGSSAPTSMINWLLAIAFFPSSLAQNTTFDPLALVDPLIGSTNGGNVFVGASLPYGLAKASPDVDGQNTGGFSTDGSNVTGFSCACLTQHWIAGKSKDRVLTQSRSSSSHSRPRFWHGRQSQSGQLPAISADMLRRRGREYLQFPHRRQEIALF